MTKRRSRMTNTIIGRPLRELPGIKKELNSIGWVFAENDSAFKGTGSKYLLKCTRCNNCYSKWLNNVLHRSEVCRCTRGGSVPFNTGLISGWIASSEVKPLTTEEIVTNIVRAELEPLRDLIVATAMSREDLLNKFISTFNGAVARRGYIEYERPMENDEWIQMSHVIAGALIKKLDPTNETTLHTDYAMQKKLQNNRRADKVLLSCLSRLQILTSISQLQIMRALM